MQIRMKARGVESAGTRKKNPLTDSIIHICTDCKINLVRQQMQLVCPKCGMVEDFFEGAE